MANNDFNCKIVKNSSNFECKSKCVEKEGNERRKNMCAEEGIFFL